MSEAAERLSPLHVDSVPSGVVGRRAGWLERIGCGRPELLLVAVALVLRVARLNRSISGDELSSLFIASRDWGSLLQSLIREDAHPPLYFLLLKGCLWLGTSEWIVRLISVMFGVFVCWLVYRIVMVCGDRRQAMASGLLVAVAPQAVWVSQCARGYTLAACGVLVAVWCAMHLVRGRWRRRYLVGYALGSAVALYTFYYAALVLVALNLSTLWMLRHSGRSIAQWLMLQLAIVALYAPWVPAYLAQTARISEHFEVASRLGLWWGGVHWGGIVKIVPGLFGLDPLFATDVSWSQIRLTPLWMVAGAMAAGALLYLVWGGIRRVRQMDESQARWMGMWLVLGLFPAVASVVLHHVRGVYLASYYMFLSFLFLGPVMAAAVLSCRRGVRIAAGVAVVVMCIVRLPVVYATAEDWKGALAYVRAEARLTDALALVRHVPGLLEMYARWPHRSLVFTDYLESDARELTFTARVTKGDARLSETLAAHPRIWVLRRQSSVYHLHEYALHWLAEHGYALERQRDFARVRLSLFVRQGGG